MPRPRSTPSQMGADRIVHRWRIRAMMARVAPPLYATDVHELAAAAGGQEQRARAGQRHVEADDDEAALEADLHLEPAARHTVDVLARLVLRHESFPPAALDLVPGVEAVVLEPEGGQYETAASDRLLEGRPPVTQCPRAQIAGADLEHVEGDKDGRRGEV